MARNALLDESRSERLELGLSFLRQLRASATVVDILEAEKAADETWGDFALEGMIALAAMRRTLRMDLRGVNRLCVGLVGLADDARQMDPTDVGSPDACRKPPAKVARRTA